MQHLTWSPVKNYEGLYQINQCGQIRSLHKRNYHNILSQRIDRAGYYTVRLSKKGRDSTQYVHRLLAFAFINNPLNKPNVNHIDGNKLNNSLCNLEFCSHSENMKHAYLIGLYKLPYVNSKQVLDTCLGKLYDSINAAADDNGISRTHCRNMLKGRRKNTTCLKFI